MRIPSPTTAIALAALTLSVGGGSAVAASKLTANSVGSREIRDRSIQVRDLAPTARIDASNRVLRQAVVDTITDPATNLNITVHGEKGDKGDRGDQGAPADPGPQGAVGPQGAPGIVGVTTREKVVPNVLAGESITASVSCEDGERALGGGGRVDGTNPGDGVVQASVPAADGGWAVTMVNKGAGPVDVRVFAMCARVAG